MLQGKPRNHNDNQTAAFESKSKLQLLCVQVTLEFIPFLMVNHSHANPQKKKKKKKKKKCSDSSAINSKHQSHNRCNVWLNNKSFSHY